MPEMSIDVALELAVVSIRACLWDSIQEMWNLDEYNEYFGIDTSEEE